MKKIIRILLLFVGIALFEYVAIYCTNKGLLFSPTINGRFPGMLVPSLCRSIIDLWDNTNWKTDQRKLMRAGILKRETKIRISFAYLFRIKINGKYLLTINKRTGKYQPIGGAYKFYNEEKLHISKTFNAEDDNFIPVNSITKNDYRLIIKNKDLRAFVKRFNKTKYRESYDNLSREFKEEILWDNLDTGAAFDEITYRYCGRHYTNIAPNISGTYELLLADIVELVLNKEQEDYLNKIVCKYPESFCLVSDEQITNYGVKKGTDELKDVVANHTYKILKGNEDSLVMKNKYKIKTVKIESDSF
ncbi:MAG: hypothetical protein IJN77_00655 [Oscillospiraceae bacterium]|nr:hypothetical protein [Oscillospiraceae bacterium]